jgi:hypothetical protein
MSHPLWPPPLLLLLLLEAGSLLQSQSVPPLTCCAALMLQDHTSCAMQFNHSEEICLKPPAVRKSGHTPNAKLSASAPAAVWSIMQTVQL